ncbi:hypothetical protein [Bosea vestrisii]|uniref:Uncharacterized protein n=1 Tax=Bosea vestrisii TaxID=151416 RepID=A0ABW0H357_9HYPH
MARLRDLLDRMVANRAARDVTEERKLLAEFAELRRDNPQAGIVVGTLDIPPDCYDFSIDLGACDFGLVHWVALADSALEHALKLMTEMPDPPADLMASIMRSRAEIDFADDSAEAVQ